MRMGLRWVGHLVKRAESEKPRQRVSIAVRKVFARIRKVFEIRKILPLKVHIYPKQGWKLSGYLETVRTTNKTVRII